MRWITVTNAQGPKGPVLSKPHRLLTGSSIADAKILPLLCRDIMPNVMACNYHNRYEHRAD